MHEVLRHILSETQLPESRFLTNENMAKHTSFKIGGPADLYIQPVTTEELHMLAKFCRKKSIPFTLLGGGTNVLVADIGIRGVVAQSHPGMNVLRLYDEHRIVAEAGATLAALAQTAAKAGLDGLAFASGIPGTVGGAVYMNAGAYERCIADVFETADILMPEGEIITLWAKDLCFAYRYSKLQDNGGIVLRAAFKLTHGDPTAIREQMKELNAKRVNSQPLEFPSAGSAFKRPEGLFAGKLISDSGLKGYQIGGAQVSEKHAGFIINATGKATAEDVLQLIAHIRNTVHQNYNVWLEPEIRCL